ncbi:oligosaccharide flippase family protein [Lactobacillus corticis]|uniref:PST family polysaccharide transporter n=1 Tax=Lactobacillus corticis TaxID=2201249 RepID=A0A916VH81_9LACO|nr:oligosaccharide flippase family protein [Lactobacillus corticis]GFZ26342.1 PST family polysaccharide transporter [Lactobacillus corticis]
MKRTLLNIFYNAIYQVFIVLVPLITVPYLSRVLGPKTYGIYSSVNNTTQFLMVMCILATSYIGSRTISRVRTFGTDQELTEAFWGLWYYQAIAGCITIALTIFVCVAFKVQYWSQLLLMVPFLISSQFDISWFFQGLADFGRVVLKNTLVKLTSIVLILLMIKSPADLWKYLLIMSITTMLGSLAFWLDIHRYVGRPTWHFYQFKTTSKAMATLMIPQIATQIYTSLDKPILGWLSTSTQVSFYDNSQRISNMLLGVITSISLVIMPKMAAQGAKEQKTVLKKSLEATVMLGLLFMVVVMANTKQFVPFFFGEKYLPMTSLMFWFTLTIVLIPTGGVFANQFALANGKDREYAIPVVVGAIIEIALSWFLDRDFGASGAMVAILVTEVVVLVLRVAVVRQYFDFRYTFHDVPYYVLIAALTLIVGLIWPNFIPSAFFNMTVKSLVMIAVYTGLMFVFKLDLNQDLKVLLQKAKGRVHHDS